MKLMRKLYNAAKLFLFSPEEFKTHLFKDFVRGNIGPNDVIKSNWLLHSDLKLKLDTSKNKLYNNKTEFNFLNSQTFETFDKYYSPEYGIKEKTNSIISNFLLLIVYILTVFFMVFDSAERILILRKFSIINYYK